MDNVWHYLGLCVALEFLGVCTGYPVTPSEGYSHLAGGWMTTTSLLLSTAFLVSAVLFVVGCLCCRQTKGFQEFTDTTSVQGYVNDAATTEFTIFPPLPPLSAQAAVNQAVRFEPLPDIRPLASRQAKKPAAFNNVVSHGLNANDWFGDGSANFPRHQLQYVRELGRGWYGRAVEGSAAFDGGATATTSCVVKILHEDASVADQMYFLHEVKPYRDLDHPNVLGLLGRCLEADPFLVLLEACPSGDLKSFLCQNIATASALSEQGVTLNMACNIAAGLQHMLDNGYVHTDLAARNCLVTPSLGIKIGDYGNSIEAFKEDYYIAGDVALPVRWCAPETLRCTDTTIETKEVTPAANVWSYGVVLWEIGEFGRLPYEELTDDEVVVQVLGENTKRLPRPSLECPHGNNLYLLMQQCWGTSIARPAMPQVMSMLAHLQRHPASGDTLRTTEDFEQRWETFKPNTIVVTDNHTTPQLLAEPEGLIIPPTSPQPSTASSCDLFKDIKDKSDSLQNLRGSLDDLSGQWDKGARKHSEGSVPASLGADFDSWLKGGNGGGETDEEDARFVQKISEAIQDLDDALALELTSSSSSSEESSKQHTPIKQNTVLDFRLGRQEKDKDSGSSDDTEEEMWRGRIERGEFSAKVKAKSKSVADLMVLTHIEPSDNSDSEPPSLTWSFERRTSNNNSFSRPRKNSLVLFGSENDIHNSILGEDFLESLHKIQVARRDSNKNNSFVEHELSTNYEAEGRGARLDGNRNVEFLEREQSSAHGDAKRDSNKNVTIVEPKQPTNQNKAASFLAIDASGKEPRVGREIEDGCRIISAEGDFSEAVKPADKKESSGNHLQTDNILNGESVLLHVIDLHYVSSEESSKLKDSFNQSCVNDNLQNVETNLETKIIMNGPYMNGVVEKEANNKLTVNLLPTETHEEEETPKKESNLLSEKVILEPSDQELAGTDEKKQVLEVGVASKTEAQAIASNKVPEIIVSETSPQKNHVLVESPRKPVPLPRRTLCLVSKDSSESSLDSDQSLQSQESVSMFEKHSSKVEPSSFKTCEENLEAFSPPEIDQDSSKSVDTILESVSVIIKKIEDSHNSFEEHLEILSPIEKIQSSDENLEAFTPIEMDQDSPKSFDKSLESVSSFEKREDSHNSFEFLSPIKKIDKHQSSDKKQVNPVKDSFIVSTPYKPHVAARQITANSNVIDESIILSNGPLIQPVIASTNQDKGFNHNTPSNMNVTCTMINDDPHPVIASTNVTYTKTKEDERISDTTSANENVSAYELSNQNSASLEGAESEQELLTESASSNVTDAISKKDDRIMNTSSAYENSAVYVMPDCNLALNTDEIPVIKNKQQLVDSTIAIHTESINDNDHITNINKTTVEHETSKLNSSLPEFSFINNELGSVTVSTNLTDSISVKDDVHTTSANEVVAVGLDELPNQHSALPEVSVIQNELLNVVTSTNIINTKCITDDIIDHTANKMSSEHKLSNQNISLHEVLAIKNELQPVIGFTNITNAKSIKDDNHTLPANKNAEDLELFNPNLEFSKVLIIKNELQPVVGSTNITDTIPIKDDNHTLPANKIVDEYDLSHQNSVSPVNIIDAHHVIAGTNITDTIPSKDCAFTVPGYENVEDRESSNQNSAFPEVPIIKDELQPVVASRNVVDNVPLKDDGHTAPTYTNVVENKSFNENSALHEASVIKDELGPAIASSNLKDTTFVQDDGHITVTNTNVVENEFSHQNSALPEATVIKDELRPFASTNVQDTIPVEDESNITLINTNLVEHESSDQNLTVPEALVIKDELCPDIAFIDSADTIPVKDESHITPVNTIVVEHESSYENSALPESFVIKDELCSVIASTISADTIHVQDYATSDNLSVIETLSERKPTNTHAALPESSVIIGPCEDYTLDYFKGLKTAYNDSDIDYSINGWDSFLGESLETHEYDDVSFPSPTPDSQLNDKPRVDVALFNDQFADGEKTLEGLVSFRKDENDGLVLINKEVLQPQLEVFSTTDAISDENKMENDGGILKKSNSLEELMSVGVSGKSIDLSGCAIKEDTTCLSTESFNVTASDLADSLLKLDELNDTKSFLKDSLDEDDLRKIATSSLGLIENLNNAPAELSGKEFVRDVVIKDIYSRKGAGLIDNFTAQISNLDEINNLDVLVDQDVLKKNTDQLLEQELDISKLVGSDLEKDLCQLEEVESRIEKEDLDETLSVTFVGGDVSEELQLSELNKDSLVLLDKLNEPLLKYEDLSKVLLLDEVKKDSHLLLENLDEILINKSEDLTVRDSTEVLHSDEIKNISHLLLDTHNSNLDKLELVKEVNQLGDLKNETCHVMEELCNLNLAPNNLTRKEIKMEDSNGIYISPANETKSEETLTGKYISTEDLKPSTLLDGDSIDSDFTLSGFHINVLATGDDLHDLEEEEECDEFSLDVKHSTPDDERSSDSGFRDNKGSLSESCEDACDEKYNLEDIEAELEETFNRGGFNHHDDNSMVFGDDYNAKCSNNLHPEERLDEYGAKEMKEYVPKSPDNFYDTLFSDNSSLKEREQFDLIVGETVRKTLGVADGLTAAENRPDISTNLDNSGAVMSVKQSGWYLHPPSELDPEDHPKSSSYVSFSLDEEFVTAIRNELIDKLPLANENADKLLASHNADDVLDMDEDDLEERQNMMIHYNIYQAPLSPIIEEPESLGAFDFSDKRTSFDWPTEIAGERFEEDIREALEGCSYESSSSSDKDPNNSILLEDLDDESKVIKVKSTSTDLEDDLLVVDTETNEAILLESPKPKPHLAFVKNIAVASADLEDFRESYSPDSISSTTTSSGTGTSEFLTPSDASPLHLPPTPAPVQKLNSNNEAAEIMADLVGMFEQDSSYEDCSQSYESSDISPVDRLDLLTTNPMKPTDLDTSECVDSDLDRTLQLDDLGQLLKLASLGTPTEVQSPVSPEVNPASKDALRQFVSLSEHLNNLNEAKDLLTPDENPKHVAFVSDTEQDTSALNVGATSMLAFSVPKSSTLEDITFSGPGVDDAGEMSTSFSGHGDEEEDDDDYAPDWESDSDENSSSSGEFIWQDGDTSRPAPRPPIASTPRPQAKAYECLSNYPMEPIVEEDEDDDDDDTSSTCSSSSGSGAEFVPSAWNSRATPTRSALRSPEKATDSKKNVSFKKQKYHCVYEYPRDSSEDNESESASWRPTVGYSNSSPVKESPALNYSTYVAAESPSVSYSSYATDTSPAVSYANYSVAKSPAVDYASYADWELMDGEDVEADTESESDNVAKTSRPDKFDFYKLGGEDYDFSGGMDDGEFFISSSARPFQPHDPLASQFFPGQSQACASADADEIDLSPLEPPTSPMSPTGLGELRHTRDRLKLNLLDAPAPAKKGRSLGGEATLLDSDTEDSGIESSNGMTAQLTLNTALDATSSAAVDNNKSIRLL